METAAAPARAVPRPRNLGPILAGLDGDIPRHWLAGNVAATHIANGVNLLFPAGERFFVRSVNRYLDRLTDENLRARVKGFFGQEGRHAREHERVFDLLERQGYDVKRFLALYERIAYGVIERLTPPWLRLSTTAAAEHFTAILAEGALRRELLEGSQMDPTMRALLLWHAAEEIEHRDVAFDVLTAVSPGYARRIAGLALATACLGGFWMVSTAMLLRQDPDATGPRFVADWRAARARMSQQRVFARGIREYLRRDFHPSDNRELDALAEQYLTLAGIA